MMKGKNGWVRYGSITDSAVFVPDGTVLSEKARETVSRMRGYMDGKNRFVLLANETGVITMSEDPDGMIAEARQKAEMVTDEVDYQGYLMDDGGTLLTAYNDIFCFAPCHVESQEEKLLMHLLVRSACKACDIMAIVYNDPKEVCAHE